MASSRDVSGISIATAVSSVANICLAWNYLLMLLLLSLLLLLSDICGMLTDEPVIMMVAALVTVYVLEPYVNVVGEGTIVVNVSAPGAVA